MKILLTADELRRGVEQMAQQIRRQYGTRGLTIVGVLIGSLVLLADLIRHLDMPLRVELIQARSYRGKDTRPGTLEINTDLLSGDICGRHALLIDDIFDTGQTLWQLIPQLETLGAASIRSAVLLRKEGRSEVPIQPDFVAFDIPDAFVVGYGLDYNDLHRNLPHIAVLEPADF